MHSDIPSSLALAYCNWTQLEKCTQRMLQIDEAFPGQPFYH